MSAADIENGRPLAGVCSSARAVTAIRLALLALIIVGARPAVAADQGQATVVATVRIDPLRLLIEVPAGPVKVGEIFDIRLSLDDLAGEPLDEIEMTLNLIEDPCLRVSGQTTHYRGHLPGGATLTRTWRVKALKGGASCRSIVVLGMVTAREAGSTDVLTAVSQARMIVVR